MSERWKENVEYQKTVRKNLKTVLQRTTHTWSPLIFKGVFLFSLIFFGIMALKSNFSISINHQQNYINKQVTGFIDKKTYAPESTKITTSLIMYAPTVVLPVESRETMPEKFLLTINQKTYEVSKDVYNNVSAGDGIEGTVYGSQLLNVKTLDFEK